MKVPRDLDIFTPFTVTKPWVWMRVGLRKPDACSTAGQNRWWKLTMSLPMKWCSSVRPSALAPQKALKSKSSRRSAKCLKLAM